MIGVKSGSVTQLEIALILYYRSRHTIESIEDFLILVTALEALYSDGNTEFRYKVALRFAIMTSNYLTNTRSTFEDVKDIYEARSNLVHGSVIPKLFASNLVNYKVKLYPIVKFSLLNYIEQVANGKTKKDILRELDDRALGMDVK